MLVAQQSSNRYHTIEDFYSEINIDYITFNNLDKKDFVYSDNYLTINTVIKYNYGLLCSSTGKILSRTYLTNNKIHVKLHKKETYYLRLDSVFSSKYYIIRI